ncbi:MAG: DMT family transporter [Candidatus Aenigmatarchaeota archaeon]
MKQLKPAYFYLALTILFWSTVPAVAKLALAELDNYQLLSYSVIVGTLSLLFINLFQRKLGLLAKYAKADYLKMFVMGILGIFLYHIFLYGSFALVPAGQANVMNYLWPVFVIVFSIPILKEKFNYKTILAVFVSFVGALIAFSGGNFYVLSGGYAAGYLLAALGAICYGLFSVLGKKFDYDKSSSMLFYHISAAVLLIPATFLLSGFVIPKSIVTVISIIILGGVVNSIGFVFWFKAIKLGHTHKTANMVYAVPFLAMLWTYFLNSEPFSVTAIIGLVFIVAGILIQLKNKT